MSPCSIHNTHGLTSTYTTDIHIQKRKCKWSYILCDRADKFTNKVFPVQTLPFSFFTSIKFILFLQKLIKSQVKLARKKALSLLLIHKDRQALPKCKFFLANLYLLLHDCKQCWLSLSEKQLSISTCIRLSVEPRKQNHQCPRDIIAEQRHLYGLRRIWVHLNSICNDFCLWCLQAT